MTRKRTAAILALMAGSAWMAGFADPPAGHDDHGKPAAKPAAAPHGSPSVTPPAAPNTRPAIQPGYTPKPPVLKPDAAPAAKPTTAGAEPKHGGHAPEPKPENKPEPKKEPEKPKAQATNEPIDAQKALTMLIEGNERWVSGDTQAPNTDAARRKSLAENGQKPFVTVLSCADSRVPIERAFDRGVGDVFVVRVAGNIAATAEIGTIEYGVGHLKTPLLVVMGHTQCGAVAAAATGAEVHGKVADLIASINPAIARARKNNPTASASELATIGVRENVWQSIFDLFKTSPACRDLTAKGELYVVGAIYDISTGKVEWLGEHPWQSELIAAINGTMNPAQADAHGGHDHEE
ncbi:MAG: carbonic anhydrase [Phycisphaerae bacterium]|nr:carbonic anhydrase [Phycisphaerae bacterium]